METPRVTFSMFEPGLRGGNLATAQVKEVFGRENYRVFRQYGKKDEYVPEEARLPVDRLVYEYIARRIEGDIAAGENLWRRALVASNKTVNYAKGMLFSDQDRRADITTNITWSDRRPSTALKVLTTSGEFVGDQYKWEQFRQLGWATICAEIISKDDGDNTTRTLSDINEYLEDRFFVGKRGAPEPYPFFSGHMPTTNRFVRLSHRYPDHSLEGLWVKNMELPVRTIGMRDDNGEVIEEVKVFYDPREKEIESAAVKAVERSLKAEKSKENGGLIETGHVTDKAGFRLVVMGGRPLRDRVAQEVERVLRGFGEFISLIDDDEVDPDHGDRHRIQFRRKQVTLEGLKTPFEVMVFALQDWLDAEFEIGEYNEALHQHNGNAHILYRLGKVAEIAPYNWPHRFFNIDLKGEQKTASFAYASDLAEKQRVNP